MVVVQSAAEQVCVQRDVEDKRMTELGERFASAAETSSDLCSGENGGVKSVMHWRRSP